MTNDEIQNAFARLDASYNKLLAAWDALKEATGGNIGDLPAIESHHPALVQRLNYCAQKFFVTAEGIVSRLEATDLGERAKRFSDVLFNFDNRRVQLSSDLVLPEEMEHYRQVHSEEWSRIRQELIQRAWERFRAADPEAALYIYPVVLARQLLTLYKVRFDVRATIMVHGKPFNGWDAFSIRYQDMILGA